MRFFNTIQACAILQMIIDCAQAHKPYSRHRKESVMKHLRLTNKIVALLLTMVMVVTGVMIIHVSAEDVYIDHSPRAFYGEYGKINITLKSGKNYSVDDFSYISVRMIVQKYPKSIEVYITEKTKDATDAAIASIKAEMGADIAYINPDYAIARVVDGDVAGDANGDYLLTIADVACTLKYIAGWNTPVFYAANVNYDNIINITDVTLMLKLIADWESVQHLKWRKV